MAVQELHRGIKLWTNKLGIDILRLHYSADEDKTAEWADQQRTGTTPEAFKQEYEIDFYAKAGELLFPNFRDYEHAIVEKPFPIPHEWTRQYALDPHPRVPHAHLWCAIDPYGDRWYYREYWPSKIYGQPGNIPEDDNRATIREHLSVIKWLESEENPENHGKPERIYRRIIDYAARSFGQGTSDDKEPQDNFQLRFEKHMRELRIRRPSFIDAIKDRDSGMDRVNAGMKAREVEINGKWVPKAPIHIFESDGRGGGCPELILQLRMNRWQQLTSKQMETHDPSSQPVQKRNHMTDLIRYHEMSEPRFIQVGSVGDNWEPVGEGVNY